MITVNLLLRIIGFTDELAGATARIASALLLGPSHGGDCAAAAAVAAAEATGVFALSLSHSRARMTERLAMMKRKGE